LLFDGINRSSLNLDAGGITLELIQFRKADGKLGSQTPIYAQVFKKHPSVNTHIPPPPLPPGFQNLALNQFPSISIQSHVK
jgi:hypothetical protein